MDRDQIEKVAECAIDRLFEQYRQDNKSFMTEGDVVQRFFLLLIDEGVPLRQIHSELKPYRTGRANKEVIGPDRWVKSGKNRGAKPDLSIVDMTYWKEACRQAPMIAQDRPKYWRFVLYPCEGFHAAFEFKVRIRGNRSRIVKDAEKMTLLHDENPDCKMYLVAMDRAASGRIIQSLEEDLSGYKSIKSCVFKE